MKTSLLLICTVLNFFFTDQKFDISLFCSKEWFSQRANFELPKKYESQTFTHNLKMSDATSYVFNSDGNFYWNDNPSCGTNVNKTSGNGTWKYQSNVLSLNFNNVMTEQRGNRKIEKYKLVKLSEKELVLEKL